MKLCGKLPVVRSERTAVRNFQWRCRYCCPQLIPGRRARPLAREEYEAWGERGMPNRSRDISTSDLSLPFPVL